MNAKFDQASQRQSQLGFFAGLGAYLWWGLVTVVYFKHLRTITPIEIIGHRIIWSLFVLFILIGARGKLGAFFKALRAHRTAGILFITASLITINWLVFFYAISINQLVQASLGYFITPLIHVLLGLIVLGERLRPMQWIAIALGTVAVCVLAVVGQAFPWIALALALTFGFYGLLRKMVAVDSAVGLTIECLIIAPLGIAIVGRSMIDPASSFSLLVQHHDYSTIAWLAGAGLVTAIPLLLFGFAARRLTLVSIGMLQYIGPTCQWLLAVIVYREKLDSVRIATFVLIWIGLALYSVDLIRNAQRTRRRSRSIPSAVEQSDNL